MIRNSAIILLAIWACVATADFSSEIEHCGGDKDAIQKIEIIGCDNLDGGICLTKHMAKMTQITTFVGEPDEYKLVVVGRRGDKSLEINPDPAHYETKCENGECVIKHRYIIAPSFESGKSTLDYIIKKSDDTVFVCYHYGINIEV